MRTERQTVSYEEANSRFFFQFYESARWGVWSTQRPDRFTRGEEPVPVVQLARYAPVLVRTGAENLTPTGIRSLDRPDRSESLYRLSYRGP
jgi:hypothetical protein